MSQTDGLQPQQQLGFVNTIYDTYRTVLLNKLYYGRRLEQFRRYNFLMEFLIAAGATGSGVAGWGVWKQELGALTWAGISAISILLAIAKPLLKLSDRIEAYSKLYGEYASTFSSIKLLVEEIQMYRQLTPSCLDTFLQLRRRAAELSALDDSSPDSNVVRAIQVEVVAQIPVEQLWVPST